MQGSCAEEGGAAGVPRETLVVKSLGGDRA